MLWRITYAINKFVFLTTLNSNQVVKLAFIILSGCVILLLLHDLIISFLFSQSNDKKERQDRHILFMSSWNNLIRSYIKWRYSFPISQNMIYFYGTLFDIVFFFFLQKYLFYLLMHQYFEYLNK